MDLWKPIVLSHDCELWKDAENKDSIKGFLLGSELQSRAEYKKEKAEGNR